MAKKAAKKVQATQEPRSLKALLPVRLDLSPSDHARMERLARERGLSKASYARQAVLERMKADEGRG